MADRRRVKKEVVIPRYTDAPIPSAAHHAGCRSVFTEPRHFGTTFRMSAQCGSVKLALEDDMLHRELRRKVQVPACRYAALLMPVCCFFSSTIKQDRCHSVSPFPDRKPRGLYARTVDLSQSQLVTNFKIDLPTTHLTLL